jgi:hypothetical protein
MADITELPIWEGCYQPALANLAGAAFERDYPELMIAIFKAQVDTTARGKDFPIEYIEPLKKYIALNKSICNRDMRVHEKFLASLPTIH